MSLIEGVVRRIEDVEIITDTFKKRNLIVVTDGDYPQTIKVEFVQDKISILDAFSKDDKIKVSYNLRGREVSSPEGVLSVYNTLHGWKIEKV